MTVTEEHQEHVRTEEALETLTRWGRNPNSDGGENTSSLCSTSQRPVRPVCIMHPGQARRMPASAADRNFGGGRCGG